MPSNLSREYSSNAVRTPKGGMPSAAVFRGLAFQGWKVGSSCVIGQHGTVLSERASDQVC